MQIPKSIRRSLAAVLLTAGLAYPACAAVCPKGIGGCTSPGRCFLFVDADGNSLCDYTGRTGSQAVSGSPPQPGSLPQASSATVPDPVTTTTASTTVRQTAATGTSSATTAPAIQGSSATSTTQAAQLAPSPDTTASLAGASSSGSTAPAFSPGIIITELALFLLFTGIIFALVRSGRIGIREERTLPALALSSLFGLGISLMITSLIAGTSATGTTFALVYMAAGTVLAAYLWYAGVMDRRIVFSAAVLATMAGFVFLAPIMPLELGGIVNVITGTSAASYGIIVICSVVALTLVVGRAFCSTICPVGSLQEIAYAVPTAKITVRRTEALELVRLGVFVLTVIAAVYLVDLMALTGLYDLFSLTLSAGLIAAAGLVLLSVFLYRPVCRILCPFGVLFSIGAEFSLLRLRRGEACIRCKKCETACPARTAGAADPKRECYLCGRCSSACPAGSTTIRYRR